MGGRGSASGISNKGKPYGTEFITLMAVDNIKFVRPVEAAATAPMETMSASKSRVYVVVNESGNLKSIAFYSSQGIRKRQIDLTHEHQGMCPHVHTGLHSPKSYRLTKRDWAYVKKVRRLWQDTN